MVSRNVFANRKCQKYLKKRFEMVGGATALRVFACLHISFG
jgi:hypothetical protein